MFSWGTKKVPNTEPSAPPAPVAPPPAPAPIQNKYDITVLDGDNQKTYKTTAELLDPTTGSKTLQNLSFFVIQYTSLLDKINAELRGLTENYVKEVDRYKKYFWVGVVQDAGDIDAKYNIDGKRYLLTNVYVPANLISGAIDNITVDLNDGKRIIDGPTALTTESAMRIQKKLPVGFASYPFIPGDFLRNFAMIRGLNIIHISKIHNGIPLQFFSNFVNLETLKKSTQMMNTLSNVGNVISQKSANATRRIAYDVLGNRGAKRVGLAGGRRRRRAQKTHRRARV